MNDMPPRLREFRALVWEKSSDAPGRHETLFAHDRVEARAMLVEKFGHDIVVSLTDVEAAERPRGD